MYACDGNDWGNGVQQWQVLFGPWVVYFYFYFISMQLPNSQYVAVQ